MTHETKQPSYGRRRFLQLAGLAAGSTLLAACADNSGQLTAAPKATAVSQSAADATVQASIGKTYFPSGDPRIPDAYTAPPPLIQSTKFVPGSGGTVKSFVVGYKPAVQPKSNNKYWQELNKRLNVDWEPIIAPGNEAFLEKSSAFIASGNIPDIFFIWLAGDPSQLKAVRQGAFTDLTSYLSGDGLKEYPNLAAISPISWEHSKIDGKIYGVPRPRPTNGDVLIFRQDWAEKVGIPNPQNADDFYKLMLAFTKNKPGGSQSWGMGLLKGYGANNFFYQMYRVPNSWRIESDGSLTYYLNTPEFKESIAYIKKLYDAGIFYPDALTQTQTKAKDGFVAGKFGCYWDGFAAVRTERGQLRAQVPDANPVPLVPMGFDGGKGNHWLGLGYFGIAAIPSSLSGNSARIKELLRILDYMAAPTFSVEGDFLANGIDGWDNTKMKGLKTLTDTGHREIGDLTYIANPPAVFYFSEEPSFGPVLQKYVKGLIDISVSNPLLNYTSKTDIETRDKMLQLFSDRFLHIMKGDQPVNSGVDAMYQDWLRNGGTQIIKELTDQLHKG